MGTAKADYSPNPEADWRAGWPALADLGLVGLCVPEERGGFGFRVDAAAAAAEELGAALHGSPFAGLCASACALANESNPLANDVLTSILAGDLLCAFGELTAGEAIARVVDGAPQAEVVIVVDHVAGCLWLCTERSSWSVNTSGGAGLRHFDVSRSCGDVSVDTAVAHRLSLPDNAITLRRLLLAADALGGLRRMLDRTVAYATQRQSFGRAIGGLQSVQHRLVDHSVRARGMSLVVAEAAEALTERSPDAQRLVTSAELSVNSGSSILHDLVQLTGAIGFTWEYGLHLYERRAHQDARLASNPRSAAGRLASLEGWTHGQ